MRITLSLLGLVPPLLAACALTGCAAVLPAAMPQYRSEYKTTVGLTAGGRRLSKEFDPVEDQHLVGLDVDVRQAGETVGFELDLLHSDKNTTRDVGGVGDVRFHGKSNEISAGARWLYEPLFADVQPYLGLGLS